eukprot:2260588-Amphidinium_carterae.1
MFAIQWYLGGGMSLGCYANYSKQTLHDLGEQSKHMSPLAGFGACEHSTVVGNLCEFPMSMQLGKQ